MKRLKNRVGEKASRWVERASPGLSIEPIRKIIGPRTTAQRAEEVARDRPEKGPGTGRGASSRNAKRAPFERARPELSFNTKKSKIEPGTADLGGEKRARAPRPQRKASRARRGGRTAPSQKVGRRGGEKKKGGPAGAVPADPPFAKDGEIVTLAWLREPFSLRILLVLTPEK